MLLSTILAFYTVPLETKIISECTGPIFTKFSECVHNAAGHDYWLLKPAFHDRSRVVAMVTNRANGRNWHAPPAFCTLAFHDGWQGRKMEARVNTTNDPALLIQSGERLSSNSWVLRRAGYSLHVGLCHTLLVNATKTPNCARSLSKYMYSCISCVIHHPLYCVPINPLVYFFFQLLSHRETKRLQDIQCNEQYSYNLHK